MHIGIFGGSFDPIHNGHLALSRHLLSCGTVDEIWLMVSPQNPLKAASTVSPDLVRMEMARKAVNGRPHIRVSDFELSLPRPSYTWRTLRALRSEFPSVDFSLVIGADNWLMFDRWSHPEEILSHHHLFVYPRPHYAVASSALPAGVSLVESPLFPYSSTEIRHIVACGGDISCMVPAAIVEDCYRLYRKN